MDRHLILKEKKDYFFDILDNIINSIIIQGYNGRVIFTVLHILRAYWTESQTKE